LISVIVPAYREAENLKALHPKLVEALNNFWEWEIIYSVGTVEDLEVCMELHAEVFSRYPYTQRGVRVVYMPERGLGLGVKVALEALNPKTQFVVTMEADGSNNPGAIPMLVLACKAFGPIVLVDKLRDSRPFVKRQLSRAFKTMLRWRYGLKRGDYNHLFRCVKMEVVSDVIEDLRYRGYEGVPEFVVRAKQKGYGIGSTVPLVYGKRLGGESKLTFRKAVSMGRLLLE
jgi:glycosyltransferase involved in cell wall biosynthesis